MRSLLAKHYPHFIFLLDIQVDISKPFINFSAVHEHSIGNIEMLRFSEH